MKDKITFTFEETKGNQSFYSCDRPILIGKTTFSEVNVAKEMKENYDKLKKYWKERDSEVYSKFLKYYPSVCMAVCISDANTHMERLVFTAYKTDKGWGRQNIQIGGSHTMRIYGGDSLSIKPHKVYLRRLAQLNDYVYAGIVN